MYIYIISMRILLISSEAYRVFLADSVLEDKTRLAAEAFNSESLATKSDIARLEMGITRLDGELTIVKWSLGLVVSGMASLIAKAFPDSSFL